MAEFSLSPTSIALLLGLAPALFWLFFWLRTDRDNPEPFGLLMVCFILGGISIYAASAFQHILTLFVTGEEAQVVLWSAIEEIVKFGVFYFVAYRNHHNNEPIDSAIYLISVALGFAALENIFYVLQPTIVSDMTASLLTGSMRFFGATLLHTISSAFIGIIIGSTTKNRRKSAIVFGLTGAIALHATFNFFILRDDTASALQIYGYLWIAAIISHVMLEKLRRMPKADTSVTTS